ncbi:MAG: hypothetical protein K6E29_09265 [Cyanobacteria bacterium RUI128]|nr:hypothetical protein [Cyanobacteria bacterium RUI128]
MDKVIETKSQMIMRIAELSEANERLQAENFELKESLKVFQRPDITKILTLYKVGDIELLEQKCDKLQAENEQLKARLRPLEDSYFKGLSSIQIAELAKKSIRITAENRKLEDALQEIRELIKKLDLSLGCAYGDYDCDNCSDINEETVCEIKLQNIILTKINEVIGAE